MLADEIISVVAAGTGRAGRTGLACSPWVASEMVVPGSEVMMVGVVNICGKLVGGVENRSPEVASVSRWVANGDPVSGCPEETGMVEVTVELSVSKGVDRSGVPAVIPGEIA